MAVRNLRKQQRKMQQEGWHMMCTEDQRLHADGVNAFNELDHDDDNDDDDDDDNTADDNGYDPLGPPLSPKVNHSKSESSKIK